MTCEKSTSVMGGGVGVEVLDVVVGDSNGFW